MATLNFTGTERKAFTPISSALANLPNGAGTLVFLLVQTNSANQDVGGLVNTTVSTWYHMLALGDFSGTPPGLTGFGDDVSGGAIAGPTYPTSTANWYLMALDWGATAGTERWHYRSQTALGAWTHGSSAASNTGPFAGPGTSAGMFTIGYSGDYNFGTKSVALAAAWAGVRFADADYGSWSKTSDLYNHANGQPTFLTELTATTPVDLTGGSTYSSGNSSGTALTGGNPDNWTFDGVGSAALRAGPRRFPLGV